MVDKIKVGIAGYGVVGKRRREFINLHPALEIVAVCDRTFDADGRQDDGVEHFTHYQSLIARGLDAIFVCMSNDMAAEVTMAGLDAGLHVFCEKPPGRNPAEIAAVIKCENARPGQKLKYGFNHRYHDSVRDALAIVTSGELGPMVNLRGMYGKSQLVTFGQDSDWRTQREIAGGGILLDQGIHMVDLLRLFGGEFTEIHSFISNEFWRHDVEDNAYALMRTNGGVVAMLHSSATQWRHRFSLEMTLERGTVILAGILSGSKSYGAETLTIARATGDDRGDPREETIRYNEDNSWRDEVDEFAAAMLGESEIINGSSAEALQTMITVYRIYGADTDWSARWNIRSKTPE